MNSSVAAVWRGPGTSDLQSEGVMRGCYVNAEQTHRASGLCPVIQLNHAIRTAREAHP